MFGLFIIILHEQTKCIENTKDRLRKIQCTAMQSQKAVFCGSSMPVHY